MELVVVILTIFLVISLAGVIFLLTKNKKELDPNSLSSELEQKLSSSIDNIFKKREDEFKKTSKENIENIIDPFKKRIKEFEDEVRKNTTQQHEFHTKTKVTIDNLIEQTNQITSDANKLTKALSGDSKTQGDYGELKLKMLLENSGLEENTHYCNTESKDEKQKFGKVLTKNIRERINDLSETRYSQIESLIPLI